MKRTAKLTTIFSMTVLDKPLSREYPEIDTRATPAGKPVAVVQCNNGLADMNAWMKTYYELGEVIGVNLDEEELSAKLFRYSMQGDPSCGGVTVIGYLSGEHVTDFESGCPVVLRNPAEPFSLANFLRAQLYSALASLAIGIRILKRENVAIHQLTGHGELFRIPGVGQQLLADAINVPVTVMKTATEDSSAYGMALLAAYRVNRAEGETLDSYLKNRVFFNTERSVLSPNAEGVKGFQAYLERFEKSLKVERAAIGGYTY